jgi:hypothetical protein
MLFAMVLNASNYVFDCVVNAVRCGRSWCGNC